MPGYTELCDRVFDQINVRKKSAGGMDKIYKKILMECSVSTQKTLHAADFLTILTAGWVRPACPVQLQQPLLLLWSVARASNSTDGMILL